MKRETLKYIWEKAATLLLAVFYAYFCFLTGMDFIVNGRPSSLFLLIFESFVVMFVLFRSMPKEVSLSYYDWALAFAGASLPLLLRPSPEPNEFLAFQILQCLGIIVSLTGLFSLNRSFGIVPANRSVKTSGMFRYIRHPIYSGYFFSLIFFSLQQSTPGNVLVTGMFMVVSILRMIAEEEFLARDEAYAAYMKKTRWRIFPFIW